MKWYTRSCERPRKRSASDALPSSVSNRYSLSIRTHGNSCRRRARSSLRRVCSFSASSSASRAASHSLRVPGLCFVIALLSLGSISHDYSAGLGRLRLDEIEREPLVDAAEERLALAQDYRVNNQPELIDQVLVQKACDEGCPADYIHVLPWLALEGSELRDVADDLRCGPRDALEGRGQNNVGCLSSQPCVRDFTLRGDSLL